MTEDRPAPNRKCQNFRQALTDAHKRYKEAKEERRAGGRATHQATRRIQKSISDICLAYVYAKTAGEAVTFPQEVASKLAFLFGDLATGHQVELVSAQRGRGRPRTSFSVEEAQKMAVRYVRAVRRGWIEDPHPVSTVMKHFRIDDATWRRWQKNHSEASTADIRATRSVRGWVQRFLQRNPDRDLEDAIEVLRLAKGTKIKKLMKFAADHYRDLPGSYSFDAIAHRGAQ